MITLTQAKQLQYGDYIHHVTTKNADGTPLRAKINGKPQTWKTRPNKIRLPCKHGLKNTFQLFEYDLKDWNLGYGS